MSKSLFEEAITDARQLRETAEQNAKNAIIEVVTPKIREFIENQLTGVNTNLDEDSGDFLEASLQDEIPDDEVELDESAMKELAKLYSSSSRQDASSPTINVNIREAFDSLTEDEQQRLLTLLNETEGNSQIVPNNSQIKDMYEIDLGELRKSVKSTMMQEDSDMQDDNTIYEIDDDAEDVDAEAADVPADEDVEADQEELVLKLAIPSKLTAGMTLSGMVELPGAGEEGDIELEDEPEADAEMPVEAEPVAEDDMTFDIDENMLRQELHRLREARKPAAKKLDKSVAASFGGGESKGFAHEVVMNELDLVKQKAIKESRDNRELRAQLNEYRSAVQTLREQLSDLNLFNAKLLYVNKIVQNKSVTPSQRRSIIEALDGAKTLRETKLLYESLTSSLTADTKTVNESMNRFTAGASSKALTSSSARISEAGEVNRWATLAGIK